MSGLGDLVYQAVRGHDQVIPELGVECLVQGELIQSDPHVVQPGVTLGFADAEGGVPHPQPRMPAQLAVGLRAAPVLDEEQREVLLGRLQVLRRVDRPEHRILGDALVEPVDQAAEGVLAAHCLVQAHGA
jgi:hypothetical protein